MTRDLFSSSPCVVWVVFQGVMVLADIGVWQLHGAFEDHRLNNRMSAAMEDFVEICLGSCRIYTKYSIFRRGVRPY